MASERQLYVVLRGLPHPFDAPDYSLVQITGWQEAKSALEAATEAAEQDHQHDYYTAIAWNGHERKTVLYVPGEGVDPDPPPIVIG